MENEHEQVFAEIESYLKQDLHEKMEDRPAYWQMLAWFFTVKLMERSDTTDCPNCEKQFMLLVKAAEPIMEHYEVLKGNQSLKDRQWHEGMVLNWLAILKRLDSDWFYEQLAEFKQGNWYKWFKGWQDKLNHLGEGEK